MADEKAKLKDIGLTDFEQAFNELAKKKDETVELRVILSMVTSLLILSGKEDVLVRKVRETLSERTPEEQISAALVTACNSLVLSLHKYIFEEQDQKQ